MSNLRVFFFISIAFVAASCASAGRPQPLFPALQDGKWGYIETEGHMVIKPQFDGAEEFSEGLAFVQIRGWFLIDYRGEVLTGPIDLYAGVKLRKQDVPMQDPPAKPFPFSDGLALVYIPRAGYGYLDRSGRYAIRVQFDDAQGFSEGLTAVAIGKKWGYVDKTGNIVIKPDFDEARSFSEALAPVKIGDKWGYVDKTGKISIEPRFDRADAFSEGLGLVELNMKTGYVDREGKTVIEPEYEDGYGFSEGLAAVKLDGKWGFIDRTGTMVIKPQFDGAERFSEGIAAVNIGGKRERRRWYVRGKWGFIDKSAKMVIKPQFDWAGNFSSGLALVIIGEMAGYQKEGYICKTGEFVLHPWTRPLTK